MSTFTGSVSPTLAVVRTAVLKGEAVDGNGKPTAANIAKGARTAKENLAAILASPHSKSSQSLAAEAVLRAEARVARGKGTSAFEAVAKPLAKAGFDIRAMSEGRYLR